MIRLTNTLTGKKEEFVPLESGKVKMYVCGPTVYGLTHVGNARPAAVFDVVRRFFEYSGFAVELVSNYTDVDDKIINRARQDGKSSTEIAELYIREFRNDMDALGVRAPNASPRVTEHIDDIIRLVEGLVAGGSAYVADDGEVFFAVRKFAAYGKLSGKNIDDLRVGVRIQPGERKRDPLDFSLWKPQKAADEPAWDSPWGKGRPGWHIECSAMAMRLLGKTFDIHGGGLDLCHPHHENEIAQSQAFTHQTYARYWLHNGLVAINNEKMSKSIGNIFLTRDFIGRYGAETLRYLLLSGHYRSPIDFSQKHIREVQAALHRVYSTLLRTVQWGQATRPATAPPDELESALAAIEAGFESQWREALEDDLNTAKVIGQVFEYVRALNSAIERKGFKPTVRSAEFAKNFRAQIGKLSSVINLLGRPPEDALSELRLKVLAERGIEVAEIEATIAARKAAREQKNYAESDRIRDELKAQKGVQLMDTPTGTTWDVVFE